MKPLRTNGESRTLSLDGQEVVIGHVYESDKPNHFMSKATLNRLGLKLATNQLPVAFTYNARARQYWLYDQSQAVPKRKLSAKQWTALEKARQVAMTCRGCGQFVGYPIKICEGCSRKRRVAEIEAETKLFFERLEQAKIMAIAWAKGVLADSRAVILNSRATGLDLASEVIQLAIIKVDGSVLMNQLIKPQASISNEAESAQPTWPELHDPICHLLQAASVVIIYNVELETRLLAQTAKRYNLALPQFQTNCAMEFYAEYYGEWSDYYNAFRWQKLMGGHSAMADCVATLELIREMAGITISTTLRVENP